MANVVRVCVCENGMVAFIRSFIRAATDKIYKFNGWTGNVSEFEDL